MYHCEEWTYFFIGYSEIAPLRVEEQSYNRQILCQESPLQRGPPLRIRNHETVARNNEHSQNKKQVRK